MANMNKVLAVISTSIDPAQLRQIRRNAQRANQTDIAEAAFRRLVDILRKEEPGTIEHAFWKTIFTFEEMLREERTKTVLLSRTRQKIDRVGVKQTLVDLAHGKSPSEGFRMLLERGRPELTAEALILKHSESFDESTVSAAKTRLVEEGIDADAVLKR